MRRIHLTILIVSALGLSWLLMQAVHELGHVAAAWATGGTVERVVLHPLTISRTDVSSNPHPLAVAWSGPIVGVLLPLVAWSVAAAARSQLTVLLRFFAGFCLIANGIYLGVGSFERIGDAGDILRHGSPIWLLWLFGLATVPAGLYLWHSLGPRFGLAAASERTTMIGYWLLGVLVLTVVVEIVALS